MGPGLAIQIAGPIKIQITSVKMHPNSPQTISNTLFKNNSFKDA